MFAAAVSPQDSKSNSLTLDVCEVAPEYALGLLGPVLLQSWQLATPEEGARKARALAKSLRQRYPRTISLIVVPEQSRLPSEAARKEAGNIPKDLPDCQGLALVREGEGFRAAAIRAIMTGMMSFGQVAPYKIVATTNEGCIWLATRFPEVPAAAIAHAHGELHRVWAAQG
jgi:hypothetical protein